MGRIYPSDRKRVNGSAKNGEEGDYDTNLLINGRVIDLFLKCRGKFPNNSGLSHKMVLAFCNLTFDSDIRPRLMSNKFVEEILKITETKDATFLSHSSMEILANLVSDGRDAWLIPNPSYDVVCSKLETTLDQILSLTYPIMVLKATFFHCLIHPNVRDLLFGPWLLQLDKPTVCIYFFSLKFFNCFERVMQNCLPNSRYENGMQYFLFFPAFF